MYGSEDSRFKEDSPGRSLSEGGDMMFSFSWKVEAKNNQDPGYIRRLAL